jgi:CBS domain-containing membrane protein
MITVAEMMTTDVETLTTDANLADVQAVMRKFNCHHVPIVAGDKLVGLVSQRDVLQVAESSLGTSTPVSAESISVSDFMTEDVFSIQPQASLRKAAKHIRSKRYGCLPVVDGDKLVGVITDSDFVNIAIDLLEQVEDSESAGDE